MFEFILWYLIVLTSIKHRIIFLGIQFFLQEINKMLNNIIKIIQTGSHQYHKNYKNNILITHGLLKEKFISVIHNLINLLMGILDIEKYY